MTRATWLLVVVLAVAAVAVWAVLIGQLLGPSSGVPSGSTAVAIASPDPSATTLRSARPALSPRPGGSISGGAPTAAQSARPSVKTSPSARTSGDGRVAYAAFLLHLDDVRATAQQLNDDLRSTGESGDLAGAAKAAGDIRALAGRERRWLAGHPPATCYAPLHASVRVLLDAYDDVASAAIAWSTATGFGVLGALQELATAVQHAGDVAQSVADTAGTTRCDG